MKAYIYKVCAIAAIALTCSCESYLVNGNLDGLWQVQAIENKQTDEIIDCKGEIYYAFQRNLIQLGYKYPNKPIGHVMHHYISSFENLGDSLYIEEFHYQYTDSTGPVNNISTLNKFGIYDRATTFHIEEFSKSSLTLTSDKARITMQKY